jgi:hypothetical protein
MSMIGQKWNTTQRKGKRPQYPLEKNPETTLLKGNHQ